MALETNLSAEDQASLDAMRAADSQPDPQAGQQPEPSATEPDGDAQPGAAAGEDADKDKPAQQKMVPHAALHEEREMRKAAERAREEERQRWEQRFEQLLQRVPQPGQQAQSQPGPAAAPEVPTFEADPVGNIVGTLKQQGATQNQIVQALQNHAAQQQQMQVIDQLQNWAIGQETEYLPDNPDYSEATDFLKNNRRAELRAFGANAVDIENQLRKDRLEIAAIAHQRNLSFPQVVMDMARTRGFAPKVADTTTAAAAAAAQPNAADKLASVAAGQQQSRSLGDARGTAPAPMTAARLLAMNDADFDKALKDPATRGLLGA